MAVTGAADTDALIEALARDVRPVARHAVAGRLALGLGAGGAATAVLVVAVLGLRPDLAVALHGPAIWMKWGYTLALGMVALATVARIARPEAPRLHWLWLAVVPVLAVAALALHELTGVPAAAREALWLGRSWRQCPLRVVALSVPIFLGLLWAFRAFAPTRLRLAGAVAGFAAGACAATLYGFACSEPSALFLLTWYSIGIAGATLLGAAAGPRVLRW